MCVCVPNSVCVCVCVPIMCVSVPNNVCVCVPNNVKLMLDQ